MYKLVNYRDREIIGYLADRPAGEALISIGDELYTNIAFDGKDEIIVRKEVQQRPIVAISLDEVIECNILLEGNLSSGQEITKLVLVEEDIQPGAVVYADNKAYMIKRASKLTNDKVDVIVQELYTVRSVYQEEEEE